MIALLSNEYCNLHLFNTSDNGDDGSNNNNVIIILKELI